MFVTKNQDLFWARGINRARPCGEHPDRGFRGAHGKSGSLDRATRFLRVQYPKLCEAFLCKTNGKKVIADKARQNRWHDVLRGYV